MVSRWNDNDAPSNNDLLAMRVYTSRLLGAESDLVLHGGGNTSVKIREADIFGEEEDILYVKGSGWDLATIESAGFAPVKLSTLHRLAALEHLSDTDMVKNQRMAMKDPSAPNPSVEAILHGIIPFTFVDHTHADAVVTITNTPKGESYVKEVYGDRVLVVPYVMPGFVLARTIYDMTRELDWNSIEGMILMNHGIFTFNNDGRKSYEKMIELVNEAEEFITAKGVGSVPTANPASVDPLKLASIRKKVSELSGRPVLSLLNDSDTAAGFSSLENVVEITNRGPLTPDHIIRTKRIPVVIADNVGQAVDDFHDHYVKYFDTHAREETMLNPAPCWGILPGAGILAFGATPKHLQIIKDISEHTAKAIYQAEKLGGWQALPERDLFDMEYWELEQAKLKKSGASPAMQGKVALVTGAASGIGYACVDSLVQRGAAVIAIDIDPKVEGMFNNPSILGIRCDVTDQSGMRDAIGRGIKCFGGLDMLVSNAGIFPESRKIAEMDEETWQKSMALNLTSHQKLMTLCIPLLEAGIDPAIVLIASKNVPAPGPGAGAYSVAKAGLTQLGRVAALELGGKGIRVNVIHPNAVYDTAIWTDEVLQARAKHYGLSVQEYKTNNILKKEVTSHDVGELAALMLSDQFAKITGAQVPIDGGNERMI